MCTFTIVYEKLACVKTVKDFTHFVKELYTLCVFRRVSVVPLVSLLEKLYFDVVRVELLHFLDADAIGDINIRLH